MHLRLDFLQYVFSRQDYEVGRRIKRLIGRARLHAVFLEIKMFLILRFYMR
jgi:hypothetical protein